MSGGRTPGPWRVGEEDRRSYTVKSSAIPDGNTGGGATVARLAITKDSMRRDEGLANARLIAAAPDGLELAEDAIPILEAVLEDREAVNGEEDEILRDLLARTRAFISKATGHSSLQGVGE